MKRLLLIYLLLSSFFAFSQQKKEHITYLTKDSLNRDLEDNWRFHVGDSAIWATASYNDTSWEIADPGLYRLGNAKKESQKFSSIGWFRFHINADTSVAGIPLALTITHYGA